MKDQPETTETTKHIKFGTFLGVFTPSVLTILGLIMYLRFGWVVGKCWFNLDNGHCNFG